MRARSSCSSRCASPIRAGTLQRVPAPVLGRHAPAHRDRHRARLPAEAADRRRADDRARRHGAGGHPAAARPAAPRDRALGHPDHARPRRDVGDRRPRVGVLRGPDRRVGRDRAMCSATPRHPYTRALLDALPHPEAEGRAPSWSRSPGRRRRRAAGRPAARSTRAARTPSRVCRERRPRRSSRSAAAARSPARSTRWRAA